MFEGLYCMVVLQGCAIRTTHNGLTYDVLGVERGVSIDDNMPRSVDLKRKRPGMWFSVPRATPTPIATLVSIMALLLECTNNHYCCPGQWEH